MARVQAEPQGGQVKRKRYYIAGPMTGLPQFNFPTFDTAAASLRSFGYEVTSPVELDKEESRAAALGNATGDPAEYKADTGETWGDLLARDVKLIADEVDAVICLPGWEGSKGARLEVFVARTCGKPVYDYDAWFDGDKPYLTKACLIPDETLSEVMDDEVFVGFEPTPEAPIIKLDIRQHQTLPLISPEAVERLKEADAAARKHMSEAVRKMTEESRALIDRELLFGRGARRGGIVNPPFPPFPLVTEKRRAPWGMEVCGNCDGRGTRDSERTFEDLTCVRCNGARVVPQGSQAGLFGDPAKKPSVTADMAEIEDKLVEHFRSKTDGSYELKGEVRVTSETGGEKGKKPEAMGLIPPEALLELGRIYSMGAEKYDDHNYLKGYDWSLSFSALLRHVLAAENGEWLDDESGLPHVMHAAWHCFALYMFERHGLGKDDRISSVVEGVSP